MTTNTIPKDLIFQCILPRLPVKSLVRFASVRKSWRDSIRSPNFTSQHLRFFAGGPVVFWNPATGESRSVLTRPVCCAPSVEAGFGGVGFGYDRASGDYKIVRVLNFGSAVGGAVYAPSPPSVDVYSLAGDFWEERDAVSAGFPESCYLLTPCCGGDDQIQIYSGGAYHWLAEIGGEDAIVSFELSHEAFLFAPMPPEIYVSGDGEWDETTALAELGGEVAAIYWRYRSGGDGYEKVFGVWVMDCERGHYGNWTKRLSIGPLSGIHRALTFCGNGEAEFGLGLVLQLSNGPLVRYDFGSEEMESVSEVEWSPISFQVMVCAESLVSFNQH